MFSLPASAWNALKVRLDANGYEDGLDYTTVDRESGFLGTSRVKIVMTSNVDIKQMLGTDGAKNEGEVELRTIVPERKDENSAG